MSRTIILIAAMIISSLFTHAQQDTTKNNTLDPVIVTANKTAQKQSTTGKAITVITKEQIEKYSGRSLTQLLNDQAGIVINGALNNMGINQAVYLRGGSSGRTLILMDGMPLNDPSLINNEFDLNLISLNNVECVEVCRGAQSTLYGSDAEAGVINIITTKQGITKPVNLKATVGGGNYGTFKGNAQVFGKAGKFTYTTRYSKLTTEGFSTANDKDSKGNFDKDGYNGDVANAAVQYQISPELAVKTFLQYSRYKTDIDANVFIDERDYTILNKSLITGAGFQYRKEGLAVTGNYQYSDNTRNYRNDSNYIIPYTPPGQVTKFSTDNYFGRGQFVELYANIPLFKGLSLLQGADYRFSSMNNQFYSLSTGAVGPYNPYKSEFKDTVHSQAALYASLMYNDPNQKFNVELGGRMNVHSQFGNNYTYTFNPSFNFDTHFRIFGSLATGFKAPTLYQLYSAYGDAGLKPERSTTFEIGIQQKHTAISNRVVYFHRIIKDGLDFNYLDYVYYNFNKQTVDGIEWESTIQPVKELTLTLNYTYLHGKENTQSRESYTDTTYTYLLRRPQHTVNFNIGYQFKQGLYVSASVKYVGRRNDIGGYQLPDVELDSYMLLNAFAQYKFKKHASIFVDAQNITNKKFFDVRGYNSIPFLFSSGVTFNL